MGGLGSGRDYWPNKKTTVEECLTLDVNWMAREGYLELWRSGSIRWTRWGQQVSSAGYEVLPGEWAERVLRLRYKSHGEHDVDLRIELQTTEPHFGGVRWWFTCPLISNGEACERRVGKLYGAPFSRYFGCRGCFDLTYESCQESHKFDRLDAEVGASIGLSGREVRRLINHQWHEKT